MQSDICDCLTKYQLSFEVSHEELYEAIELQILDSKVKTMQATSNSLNPFFYLYCFHMEAHLNQNGPS